MNWVKRQHKEPNEFLCELSDDEDVNEVLPTETLGKTTQQSVTPSASLTFSSLLFSKESEQHKPFDCNETTTNSKEKNV